MTLPVWGIIMSKTGSYSYMAAPDKTTRGQAPNTKKLKKINT